MRMSIASPYRENSIINIARRAAEREQLEIFYTSLNLDKWQGFARRMPAIGAQLEREVSRRVFPGVPSSHIAVAGMGSEITRVAFGRLLGRRGRVLASRSMYWSKAKFDASVARELRARSPNVLIGMFGASLESFKMMRQNGGLTVLNFVNSHPRDHNRYLMELGGVMAGHHELIPAWVSERVEEELELASLVLVPSKFVASQLVEHGVPDAKIALLPYGVNLAQFYPSEKRTGVNSVLDCLYVGQISYRKGVRILLEAARRCRHLPVRFHLVGPVVSAEVIERLPGNVVYRGASLPAGIAGVMRSADLFVLPSIEDACALVLLEAMASGLPVITTSNNGSGELINEGEDGVVVLPGDATALAEAISRLVTDPATRREMAIAARKKVVKERSWDCYADAVLKRIETLQ